MDIRPFLPEKGHVSGHQSLRALHVTVGDLASDLNELTWLAEWTTDLDST
jgi:hypothetical protein